MCKRPSFKEVSELFEKHGYKLVGFWRRQRVFCNPDDAESLAFVFPVDDDGTVDKKIFESIKKYLNE